MFGLNIWVIGNAGTHVRVQTEHLSGRDIQGLEPATLRGSDRCLEEDFRAAQRFPSARLYAGINSAEINLLADLDGFGRNPRPRFVHDLQSSGHDLRADAVAVSHGDRYKVRCHSYRAITSERVSGHEA